MEGANGPIALQKEYVMSTREPGANARRLSSAVSSLKEQYTVVVVGSGYGGGITASRLARSGQQVCVLERGKEFLPGEFPDTMYEATAQTQVNTAVGHVGSDTGRSISTSTRTSTSWWGAGWAAPH